MKNKYLLLLALPIILALGWQHPVTWQFDQIRQNNKSAEKEMEEIQLFNKTNTNPSLVAHRTKYHIPLKLNKEDIEFGYRGDGVVVWRVPPEIE